MLKTWPKLDLGYTKWDIALPICGPFKKEFISADPHKFKFFAGKKNGATSFCQLAVLSYCFLVKLFFHWLAILSNCCFISLLFCRFAFASTCYYVNLLFHWHDVLSTCCFVNLLYRQLAILSTFLFHQLAFSSNYFNSLSNLNV